MLLQKKPIQLLAYIHSIDRAILLVDSIVCVFDTTKFDISTGHDRLKNSHTFCVNERVAGGHPFSHQVMSEKCYGEFILHQLLL